LLRIIGFSYPSTIYPYRLDRNAYITYTLGWEGGAYDHRHLAVIDPKYEDDFLVLLLESGGVKSLACTPQPSPTPTS
jgi:hypothetical protein